MSAWTPGPWVSGISRGSLPMIWKKGKVVCRFGEGIDDTKEVDPNWQANQRLITLAPEMAEALANCVRSISLALNEHSNRRPKGLTGQMPERWLELSKQLTVTRALLARLEGKA